MATYVDVLGGITDDTGYKAPVVAASPVDLGTALTGLVVMDGVQTAAGNRVLLWKQADQTTNGVYEVATGAWSRAIDFSSSSSILDGTQILVTGGNTYAGIVFVCQVSNPVFGTTNITFTQMSGGTPLPSAAPYREITSGTTDTASTADANGFIVWNVSTGGAKTSTVPPASAFTSGETLTFKDGFGDSGINPITIAPESGSIDGASSVTLSAAVAGSGAAITIVANKEANLWRRV